MPLYNSDSHSRIQKLQIQKVRPSILFALTLRKSTGLICQTGNVAESGCTVAMSWSCCDQAALRQLVKREWQFNDLRAVVAQESTSSLHVTPKAVLADVCCRVWDYDWLVDRVTIYSCSHLLSNEHGLHHGISRACLTCNVELVVTELCTVGWPSSSFKMLSYCKHENTRCT